MFAGYFDNGDGLLVIHVGNEIYGYRLLLTDSGHCMPPTDNYSENSTEEAKQTTLLASAEMKLPSGPRPPARLA